AEALEEHGAVRFSQVRLAETDLEPEGVPEFMRLAGCLGAVPAEVDKDDNEERTGGDICKTALAAGQQIIAKKKRSPDGDFRSCEVLRERTPLKYPRLIDNGQDLVICSGEHRRLRGREVADCAEAAGLKRLQPGDRLFGNRLDLVTVRSPPAMEWLG